MDILFGAFARGMMTVTNFFVFLDRRYLVCPDYNINY